MQEYDGGVDRGQGGDKQPDDGKQMGIWNLCGLFGNMAINEQQETNGAVHADTNDMRGKLNCAIPFGRGWEGAETVFWELEKKICVPYGYGIFFPGSTIHHNVINITGSRNSLDLFNDAASKTVWEKMKAERGRIKHHPSKAEKSKQKEKDRKTAVKEAGKKRKLGEKTGRKGTEVKREKIAIEGM